MAAEETIDLIYSKSVLKLFQNFIRPISKASIKKNTDDKV